MGAPWKLIQQILRDATEDESFAVIADKAQVYSTLRTLQRTLRDICQEGRILQESEVAGSRFRYAIAGGVLDPGPEKWLLAVERALQIVEQCEDVPAIRAYLTTRKRTHTDFRNLCH